MSTRTLESIEYAAARLNIPLHRAYELARQDILPVVRLGRQIKIDPEQLEQFITSGGKALPGGWRKE